MELQQRKQNRIPEYDYNQNGAYFVTICTQDRKPILSTIVGDDAHIVPKPYGIITEKYIRNAPEIEKYVIMPDHIHMIIRLDNGPMWASAPTNGFYMMLPNSHKLAIDISFNCGIILYVPNGGLAQLVRAHASHA